MKKFTFERSRKFRNRGFITAILAITYLTLFQDMIGTVIILAISLYCDYLYKCPHCHKTLDIRENPDRIECCPYCGRELKKSSET